MKIYHTLGKFCIGLTLILTSCVSSKEITYFQTRQEKIDPEVTEIINQYTPRIQSGDVLSVLVSSISKEANEMFNPYAQSTPPSENTGTIAPKPVVGFLVDNAGYVKLPMIGMLKVSDLTTEEARLLITNNLEKYLVSPTVNVRIANYKVSVLGEVARPATYTIPNEIMTIPQILALAGDLTIYGKRENILVIREENGKRIFARIDLRSRDLFNSDYYYLHPNDIVYVETKKSKATSTDVVYQLTPVMLSALTFVLTIARFFTND